MSTGKLYLSKAKVNSLPKFPKSKLDESSKESVWKSRNEHAEYAEDKTQNLSFKNILQTWAHDCKISSNFNGKHDV